MVPSWPGANQTIRMSIHDQLAHPNRLPETIVSTDAIEQLNPFVSASGQPGEAVQPHWRKRDYLLGGVCTGQKWLTATPLLLGDLIAMLGCHYLASIVIIAVFGFSMPADHLLQGWATAIVFAGAGLMIGLYPATAVSPVVELRQTVVTGWLAFATIMLLNQMLATLSNFEMIVGLCGAVFASVLVPLVRNIVRHHFARYRWWGERVIIIGSGVQGQAIYRFYQRGRHRGLKPVGIVDSAETAAGSVPAIQNGSMVYLGPISRLPLLARKNYVHWGIVAPGGCEGLNMSELIRFCGVFHHLILLPTDMLVPSLWSASRECAGVMGIHVRDHLRSPLSGWTKRSFDIIGAAAGMIVASPILLSIAVLVKLKSPGPVFYGHERIGKSGVKFKAWKFRSMVPNAAEVLDKHLERDPELRRQWFEDQKLRNDPRIIPGIGNLIRKTSLDELPQLWNVLVGDMSLVGPRPIVTAEIERYSEMYPLYLRVRPGITGLWQVSGRNDTSYNQRVRLDCYYVCNWSIWLDVYIVMRTFKTVMLSEGAY